MPARLGFSARGVPSSPEFERLIVENSDLQIGIHISHFLKNGPQIRSIHISHLVKNEPQIIREFEQTIKAVPFSIAIMHFLILQY